MRMAVITVLLAALLAGCTSSPAKPPTTPVSVPVPPVSPGAPLQPAQGPLQTAPAPSPAASPAPDLSKVLDVAWAPDRERVALLIESGVVILDLQSHQLTPWPSTYAKHMKLAGWKSDGSGVYLAMPDRALVLVDPSGAHELIAGSQTHLPYAVGYAPSPTGPLVVRDAGGQKLQLVGANGAWEGRVEGWSPTGRYLAYNDDRSLHLVDVASGRDTVAGIATSVQWHPRGERFLARGAKGLEVRTLSGDSVLQLPSASSAAWSADGSRIVYQDTAAVWTVDADGKNRQRLLKEPIDGLQSMVWLAEDEIVFSTVRKAGGGGTTFDMSLITAGKIQALAGGTRSTLLVSPDKRRVAYLVGPPDEYTPASLKFYPPLK